MAENELGRIISEAVTAAIQRANTSNISPTSTTGPSNSNQNELAEKYQNEETSNTNTEQRAGARPRKSIDREQLENLLGLRLPISTIARSLGVSHPTVYAAMKENNIPYEGRFTDHCDEDLNAAVTAVKCNHPNSGEVMVQGHLRSQGIHVQRSRVRSTIKNVDPEGLATRRRLRIH